MSTRLELIENFRLAINTNSVSRGTLGGFFRPDLYEVMPGWLEHFTQCIDIQSSDKIRDENIARYLGISYSWERFSFKAWRRVQAKMMLTLLDIFDVYCKFNNKTDCVNEIKLIASLWNQVLNGIEPLLDEWRQYKNLNKDIQLVAEAGEGFVKNSIADACRIIILKHKSEGNKTLSDYLWDKIINVFLTGMEEEQLRLKYEN